ncbi:MAG: class I SAM-dependent methyltransferase [Planctomycetes bacterium]|nr:class I SAM-dependent methyltransferase [Planctomycetota bacterium]
MPNRLKSGISLRCPACRAGSLGEQPQALVCPSCGAAFPCLPSGACDLLKQSSADEAAQREVYDEMQAGHWATSDPMYSYTTLTGIRFTRALRRLKLPQGAQVLEVGCASGPVMASLEANYGARAFGLDVSLASVDMQLRRRGNFNYDAVAASALDLPFADATFDAVVSFDVIEHLEKPEAFWAEAARVLKPGGKALVRGAVMDFALTVDWLRFHLDHGRWMARMDRAGHFYKNFRGKRQHADYARAAGLTVTRVRGSDLFWENLADYYMLPLLFSLAGRRSPTATTAPKDAEVKPLELRRPNSMAHKLWRAWLTLTSWALWPEKVLSALGFGASAYFEVRRP